MYSLEVSEHESRVERINDVNAEKIKKDIFDRKGCKYHWDTA